MKKMENDNLIIKIAHVFWTSITLLKLLAQTDHRSQTLFDYPCYIS